MLVSATGLLLTNILLTEWLACKAQAALSMSMSLLRSTQCLCDKTQTCSSHAYYYRVANSDLSMLDLTEHVLPYGSFQMWLAICLHC